MCGFLTSECKYIFKNHLIVKEKRPDHVSVHGPNRARVRVDVHNPIPAEGCGAVQGVGCHLEPCTCYTTMLI